MGGQLFVGRLVDWLVGRWEGGVCLVWLVRVEGTLSIQDLVCDGSRGVSV